MNIGISLLIHISSVRDRYSCQFLTRALSTSVLTLQWPFLYILTLLSRFLGFLPCFVLKVKVFFTNFTFITLYTTNITFCIVNSLQFAYHVILLNSQKTWDRLFAGQISASDQSSISLKKNLQESPTSPYNTEGRASTSTISPRTAFISGIKNKRWVKKKKIALFRLIEIYLTFFIFLCSNILSVEIFLTEKKNWRPCQDHVEEL